jgi:hypothetical protein
VPCDKSALKIRQVAITAGPEVEIGEMVDAARQAGGRDERRRPGAHFDANRDGKIDGNWMKTAAGGSARQVEPSSCATATATIAGASQQRRMR